MRACLQYALLEERYGLAKHSIEIYSRAAAAVPKSERMAVYDMYLAKAQEFFGIGKVRATKLAGLNWFKRMKHH